MWISHIEDQIGAKLIRYSGCNNNARPYTFRFLSWLDGRYLDAFLIEEFPFEYPFVDQYNKLL